jgi:hypothetical protein
MWYWCAGTARNAIFSQGWLSQLELARSADGISEGRRRTLLSPHCENPDMPDSFVLTSVPVVLDACRISLVQGQVQKHGAPVLRKSSPSSTCRKCRLYGGLSLYVPFSLLSSSRPNGSSKNRIKRKQGAISPSDQSTNIRPLLNFDIASTIPYPYRPWSSGKFAMTMGIQKVEQENWLTLDNRYVHEQSLRRELLAKNREGVMQMLPGSEAACTEMLDLIVSFLTSRYPQLFFRPVGKPGYLHNSLTNRTFKVTAPYEISPLEIAAQLIMEDLNLLIQGFGDDSEQHYL